ncbi:acyl transferase domain-containing protein [Kitasatospora sp. MAP12-15]|uniref:type I polyketide synthase n=1 Tax=unclassified Kitasatospora TaxID=2633591 RepID=UPI002473F029|nr:type I polyketide synthase [Kitasatospora sp. MAP12-44]MDH6113663.1 acyl transferase domain-containing protein [Kitasatospora sp. MAP12-44]
MADTRTPDSSADARLNSALAAIRQLRGKLDSLEQATREGIAIVGMGCRLPGGVDSPDALWELVSQQVDAVTEVPASRWDVDGFYDPDPATPGRMTTRSGAFIDAVDEFDPYFFGISPREAARMDPQQRHFLEVAWEALEDAGLTREALQGSGTGVFVACNSSDYQQLQLQHPMEIDTFTAAGSANSLIPNRLSYLFDLRGPSLTVDSACSSSLVAVHLAAQSLRSRECDAAVVGGTNLLLSPLPTMTFDKIHALSTDGRCKTFDARANGYVRGEGVGVVVLKRLSDALAAGDRIRAVIRGSAVNQDGLTNGLTAPNGLAQRAVITQALRNARLEPHQVTLVEAHGTGTPLGDPIEVEALNEVYGAAEGGPCALGSIKTNIGHLEAGSGIAGLIKTALCVEHKAIAPNLHFETLNPHISLDGSRLSIPTEPRAWDAPDDCRHAAVSSFGAGGTNAHVILGPGPVVEPVAAEGSEQGSFLLPFSARTPDALAPMALAYRDHLRSPAGRAVRMRDLVHTASARRTQHEYRCAVVADSPEQAADRLTSWLDGKAPASVVTGRGSAEVARGTVFVFAGHGSQWAGMGRELMRDCAVFRDAVTECDQELRKWLGRSVIEEIHQFAPDAPLEQLEQLDLVQPALFAISIGLAARWRSFGIVPDLVIGHSMGEVAAAHVAGALSLPDAAKLICLRSSLLERLRGRGGMLATGLDLAQAEELIAPCRDEVSVAVANGPSSTVLSGAPATLAALAEQLRERNVFGRLIKVAVAGHSPQVAELRADLLAGLADLTPRACTVPMISTVTAAPVTGTDLDAEYWYTNLRRPVRFWETVRSAIQHHDAGTFVEMSPHPLLTSAVADCFEQGDLTGLALPSMRREEPEADTMLASLGAMHCHGLRVALPAAFDAAAHAVPLPGYAWQREQFWFRERRQSLTPDELGTPGAGPVLAPAAAAADEPGSGLLAQLAAAGPAEHERIVTEAVRETVAEVLCLDPARIDPQGGFFHLGMDSVLAAQVRTRMAAALDRRLPTAVMFEHPSVDALGRHLAGLLTDQRAPQAPAPTAPEAQTRTDQDVAELSEGELLTLLADEIRASTRTVGSTQ